MKIKPRRLSYLVELGKVVLILGAMQTLGGIIIIRDDLNNFSFSRAVWTGIPIGALLVWAYDELTRYARLSIVLSATSISVPQNGFSRKSLSLSELDSRKTLSYNSKIPPHRRGRFTLVSRDGSSIVIQKRIYEQAQVDKLLKKLGLSQAQ
jgi:hypothetical protein